MIATRVTVVEL